ncbi:hypothetical protein FDUTEX481_05929 [Tolypothrix sp. PCC 7601]|nr:hypothetical protein FDUTEX481_05929 [Tolypothrix sp. PCC 7601]
MFQYWLSKLYGNKGLMVIRNYKLLITSYESLTDVSNDSFSTKCDRLLI